MTKTIFAAAAVLLLFQSAALSQQQTAKGVVLVDKNKMTLYTFDKDTEGRGTCVGACAENWPPYADGVDIKPREPGPWLAVARDDGSKMWAYKGKPVYLFKNDKAPGDVNGDGVNGVWHVIHLP